MATAAASGPSAIVIWLIAAAGLFVPLVFATLELSSRYPEEGGVYVWSKRAFGPFSAFMTGWSHWTTNLPYFPSLLYFAAGNLLFSGGPDAQALSTNSAYFMIVSMVGLAFAVTVNVIGVDIGKWLSNAGAVAGWISAFTLIALGITAWFRFGSATPLDRGVVRAEHEPEGRDLLVDDRLCVWRRRERIGDGRGDQGCPPHDSWSHRHGRHHHHDAVSSGHLQHPVGDSAGTDLRAAGADAGHSGDDGTRWCGVAGTRAGSAHHAECARWRRRLVCGPRRACRLWLASIDSCHGRSVHCIRGITRHMSRCSCRRGFRRCSSSLVRRARRCAAPTTCSCR